MKKFMPVVISSALALSFAGAAQADGPIDGTVYGKIYMTMLKSETKGVSDNSLDARNSRLGFKGKTAVDGGLNVIYQLEYGVEPTEASATVNTTTGDTNIFSQRNAFLGLSGDFGTILGGTSDTPLKSAQGSIDQFNDLPVGDIASLVNGEVRANDVVAYVSPTFNNISVMAAVTQDEGSAANASSFNITYKANGLYLAAAHDSKVGTDTTTRVVAEYAMDAFTVGALHSSSKATASASSLSGNVVTGSYKIDKFKLKAQFGKGDEKGTGGKLSAVGFDYILGKKSRVYVYTAKYSNDDSTKTLKATAVGLEHNF